VNGKERGREGERKRRVNAGKDRERDLPNRA